MSQMFVDFRACLLERKVSGTPSQRAGLYYERKVVRWFTERFPLCAPQPVIYAQGRHFRPDLLVFDASMRSCVVVEVKHQFVWSAQSQALGYMLLLREAFSWLRLRTLIVCGQMYENYGPINVIGAGDLMSLREGCNAFVLSERVLRLAGGKQNGLRLGGKCVEAVVRQPGCSGDPRSRGLGFHGLAPEIGEGGA